MQKIVKLILMVVIPALLSVGCVGSLGLNLFPDSKDIDVEKPIDQEIRKNPKESLHGSLPGFQEDTSLTVC